MRVCPKRTRADEAIPNPNPSMFMIIKMPSSSPDYLQNNPSSSGPELGRPSLAAGNAGDEVAALQLLSVDEEELERFRRSASL